MNLPRQLMTSQCFYSGAYFTAGLVSNTPKSHFNKACIYSEQCVMANVIWVRQADSSSSTWFTEVFVLVLCICAILGTKLDFWEHKSMLWYRSECDYVHPDWNDGLVSLITENSFFYWNGNLDFQPHSVMKCVWVKWSLINPMYHNPKSILLLLLSINHSIK